MQRTMIFNILIIFDILGNKKPRAELKTRGLICHYGRS